MRTRENRGEWTHIGVNTPCIGENLHLLKVHASSCEVVHVDGPSVARNKIGRVVLSRDGQPCERLVAEVAREIDDNVCVVDPVGIG